MLRDILLSLIVIYLFAGCSSKKVSEDHAGALPSSSVSSETMSFDAEGSDSGKIDGLRTIHFQFNKSSLDKNEMDILVKDAEWMKSHKSVAIQIEGHCDNRGSLEYNLSLGERRAKTAYDYLLNLGVSPKQLSTVSYGKERPLTHDESDEAQAKNRRDNFVVGSAK